MRKQRVFRQERKAACVFLRVLSLLLLFSLVCSLFACAPQYKKINGYGMGSYAVFTVEDERIAPSLIAALATAENDISHRVATSAVAALNRGETVVLPASLVALLETAAAIGEKTNGRFSVFSLPETSLWDFDASSPVPPAAADIAKAVGETAGARLLPLSEGRYLLEGGGIDLGAVGKGYATDALARLLALDGQSGIIAVGGSIAAVGEKQGGFKIGVRDPFSTSREVLLGVLTLSNGFVSTSGSYEKRFTHEGRDYHHILDAQTGLPVQSGLVSVTVLADSGALADMLSTAAFILGLSEGFALLEQYGAKGIFVTEKGEVYASSALSDSFRLTKGEVQYR
ncbi:MAG: FAD:protein FMN transferase [Clostridia bacterium]|nr:FAD:protein FMN transferase [Clostridia bacterium]